MADKKVEISKEREYVIPLRKEWMKVANYRRAGRAAKAIKKFIAKHMKVSDRDISKVKIDVYLNQEIWFRGRKKPPAKIKVKAVSAGELVKVSLAEIPERVKFIRQKQMKHHFKSEKSKLKESKKKEKLEDEEKNDLIKEESEKSKSKSVEETKTKDIKTHSKAEKQSKVKESVIHRKTFRGTSNN